MKKCTKCKCKKQLSEFNNVVKTKDGFSHWCKVCVNDYNKKYFTTKRGLISSIYGSQRSSSRKRNHPRPSYIKQELTQWLYSQTLFHELFDKWKISNYKTALKPSCDRKDDFLPYTLNNLQLMTWGENKKKGYLSHKKGENHIDLKPIVGINKETCEIVEFISINDAVRKMNICQSSISQVCNGKRNLAGGYYWNFI